MNHMVKNTQQTSAMCEFKHVSKAFTARNRSDEVLHDINLTIPRGSFTILYGPSGSGKTTILNTMVGLEPVSSGQVYVDGANMYAMNADQRAHFRAQTVGMVHQDNYWVNSLSVLDNIALPLTLAGWEKSRAHAAALQSLERIGLQRYAHSSPVVLSGGEQQRVSFARATVIQPKLLVADEPTGNLDSKNGEMIISLLKDFNTSHDVTIVLVTHNEEFLSISNNTIYTRDGHIVTEKEFNKPVVAA